jgi:hypothetical protein
VTWQTLGKTFCCWRVLCTPTPVKLETAKGSMDTLPTRVLSQVLPRACAHLYRTARQGTFILQTFLRNNGRIPDRGQTCVRMRAIYQYVFGFSGTHLTRQLTTRSAGSRSPCRAVRFCTS